MKTIRNGGEAPGMIAAELPAGTKPVLTVTTRAATRDWAANLDRPGTAPRANASELNNFLRPARDLYGIRVAKSQIGFKSLGPSSDNITKAQHCRAEVYLNGYGWVPVDPADVRKVMLEETPGNRPLDHELAKKARQDVRGMGNELDCIQLRTGCCIAGIFRFTSSVPHVSSGRHCGGATR